MAPLIRSLPTKYRGFTFRSQLEARWAVFLNYCGAEWEYEPKRYNLGKGIRYLPDFLVHDVLYGDLGQPSHSRKDLYIEVKGVMTPEDREKIKRFGYPNFPLLVVRDIPAGYIDYVAKCMIEAGNIDDYFYNFQFIDGDVYPALIGASKLGGVEIFTCENYEKEMHLENNLRAFVVAHTARFDHGWQKISYGPCIKIERLPDSLEQEKLKNRV